MVSFLKLFSSTFETSLKDFSEFTGHSKVTEGKKLTNKKLSFTINYWAAHVRKKLIHSCKYYLSCGKQTNNPNGYLDNALDN